ncbi:MAG: DUF4235 domain-containing protein [Actinomycetes bacterium]
MSGAEIETTEPQVNPMVHVIAPIVAFGATMLVRKVLQTGYRLVTGSDAPDTRDPQVKFTRALTWTIITAATAAVVEVEVYRFVNKRGEHTA